MIDLKCYIKESLLDDEDTILDDTDQSIRDSIENFLKENYGDLKDYKISDKPNEDGKYVVDCNSDLIVTYRGIPALTNEYFVFGKVKRNFYCANCRYLKSLKGAPKEVGNICSCSHCYSLKSLEGAPEKMGGDFYCVGCSKLTSLEGAPKYVGEDFYCRNCGGEFTEEDVKNVSNVKKRIYT